MTRIESQNKTPDQLGEVQDEIQQLKKQLKRKQSKKFFNCTSCSFILIIIFLCLGAVLAAVMAKSGLWQIPLFSDYFYHEPKPVYQVTASSFTESDLISRLTKQATSEALKQKKSSNIGLSFILKETELTSLLLLQINKNKSLVDNFEIAQIALLADSAELFVKADSPENLIITLKFVPEIKDGKLYLAVKKFKVGDLSLLKFLGKILVENIGAEILNSVLAPINQVGKIESITLAEHNIISEIIITNLKF